MGYYRKRYRRNYYRRKNANSYKEELSFLAYFFGLGVCIAIVYKLILFVFKNIESILILFAFISLSFLSVFCLYKIIKKRYKNKQKLFEEQVFKYSSKINYIIDLNKKQNFHDIQYSYVFKQTYDIKRDYHRISPLAYMEAILRKNYDYYSNIKQLVNDNSFKYQKYISDVNLCYEHEPLSDEKYREYKLNKKKFLKYENKILDFLILPPFEPFLITVSLQYISKGKRVFDQKKDTFNFEQFSESLDNIEPGKRMDYETYKRFEATERSLITDELRMAILKEGKYRCAICGATAKDGAKLEVDHIIPIAKGGKSNRSNLQVLCHRCNKGKSDTLI